MGKMVNAVSANSRSAVYAKKVVYKRKRWLTTAEKKAAGKSPVVGKPQRHYPTDEARRRFKTTGAGKPYRATKKLKAGIEVGSVLILVAGKHRGKRVVFLNSKHNQTKAHCRSRQKSTSYGQLFGSKVCFEKWTSPSYDEILGKFGIFLFRLLNLIK